MANTAAEVVTEIEAAFTLTGDPPQQPLSVSDQFKAAQNHPAGIRAPHALEALQGANEVHRWRIDDDDLMVVLALARPTRTRPYAALIEAIESPTSGPGTSVRSAWRLYGVEPENPTQAFGELVEQFGIPIEVSALPAQLFVAETVGDGTIKASDSSEATEFQMSALMVSLSPGVSRTQFAYAIDTTAYHRFVASHR